MPINALSIISAVTSSSSIVLVGAAGETRSIAAPIASVASEPFTRSSLAIDSRRTCAYTIVDTAEARLSVPLPPAPSITPSVRSDASARTAPSPFAEKPAARKTLRVRRTISPRVSEAFTISAMLDSSMRVLIGPVDASPSSPLFNAVATVRSALSRFAAVSPPDKLRASATANVEKGLMLTTRLLPDSKIAPVSAKSGFRFVTRSVPPVASTESG